MIYDLNFHITVLFENIKQQDQCCKIVRIWKKALKANEKESENATTGSSVLKTNTKKC